MKNLDGIIADAKSNFDSITDLAALEQPRARFLGKRGALTEMLKGLGKLSAEERPQAGALINRAKQQVEALLQARRETIEMASRAAISIVSRRACNSASTCCFALLISAPACGRSSAESLPSPFNISVSAPRLPRKRALGCSRAARSVMLSKFDFASAMMPSRFFISSRL